MKIQCSKETLLNGIQQVQNIVAAKTTLPVLSDVLVEAQKESLTLTTTDLEVGIRCRFPAKVAQEGTTTLPARRLSNIVRELPDKAIHWETLENDVSAIRCGSSSFKIMGIAKDEFPKMPQLGEKVTFKIDQKVFKDLVKKTSYAISHDETRYVLSGLFLGASSGKLVVVATDGKRLALIEKAIDLPENIALEVVIPNKAINELSRILKDEGSMVVAITKNVIAFDLDDSLLVSRLIEGKYPSYRQVIPEKTTEKILLNREELLQAVRRVAQLTTERSNSIKLVFSKGKLVISANSPEVGEAREEIEVGYEGKEVQIAFNPLYLMDVLKNLEDQSVFFEMTDSSNPGLIRTDYDFVYVIMPMRLS